MNLANEPVRAYSKEDQIKHNRTKKKAKYQRHKPTARQRGDISTKTRKAVRERSGGRCERCGWMPGQQDPRGRKWGLQAAHLLQRRNCNETTETEVADLCGPSVNSGTCHHWVDSTKAGRKWALKYREELLLERD